MTRVVANNAPFQLLITPRDAAGQPITNLGNIAKERWVVTDGTYNFTVNSSDTQLNNPYVQYLLSITPNVLSLGNKNLTIKLDNATVATAPSPLEYDFRPGYTGRFSPTNAAIMWDMTLDSASVVNVYDASGNSRTGNKITPAAYDDTKFTASSVYKTSTAGQNITLGRSKVGSLLSAIPTNLNNSTTSCGLYTGFNDLCSDIAYANGLPLRTIMGVYYRSVYEVVFGGVAWQYGWSKTGGTGNEGFRIYLSQNNIILVAATASGSSSNVASIAINTGSHLWDYNNGIAFIAARVNSIDNTGLANITLFVNNESASGNFQFGTSTVTDSSHKKCVSGFGANAVTLTSTSNIYSCFDFAAYNDVKSDAFIAQMRQAWGL